MQVACLASGVHRENHRQDSKIRTCDRGDTQRLPVKRLTWMKRRCGLQGDALPELQSHLGKRESSSTLASTDDDALEKLLHYFMPAPSGTSDPGKGKTVSS